MAGRGAAAKEQPESTREGTAASAWVSSLAGGVAGSASRFATNPFDVLKIRMQLQAEPIRRGQAAGKYQGVVHCLRTIVTEEGVQALWKGHLASQLLTITYCAVQFPVYETLVAQTRTHLTNQALAEFFAGSGAGVVASLATYPFDITRTRLAAQGHKQTERSLVHSIQRLLQTSGLRGLYRGFGVTVSTIVPYSGLHFAVYARAKQAFGCTAPAPHPWRKAAAGLFAGVVTKTCLHPMDIVKKRLQVAGLDEARQHFGRHRSHVGVLDCVRDVLTHEGPGGFMKGLVPALLKSGPATMITFIVYEQLRRFLVG